jgi:hypothetical protein
MNKYLFYNVINLKQYVQISIVVTHFGNYVIYVISYKVTSDSFCNSVQLVNLNV